MDSNDVEGMKRVAEVLARVACLNAEIAAMQAHDRVNQDTPYTEGAYRAVLDASGCGVNDVISTLRHY